MFKELIKDPLHITLTKYRALYIISIWFLGHLMLRMWDFYETNFAQMTTESAAAFFAFAAAVLGAFVSCVTSVKAPHS